MKKIVVSVKNGLLAEAITKMLSDSGEFLAYRAEVGGKNSLSSDCVMFSADIVLAEVSYSCDTTVETRLDEIKTIRNTSPNCKIALLCDENSAPEIAHKITNAKRDGIIDAFFYSSVTSKYLTAALISI